MMSAVDRVGFKFVNIFVNPFCFLEGQYSINRVINWNKKSHFICSTLWDIINGLLTDKSWTVILLSQIYVVDYKESCVVSFSFFPSHSQVWWSKTCVWCDFVLSCFCGCIRFGVPCVQNSTYLKCWFVRLSYFHCYIAIRRGPILIKFYKWVYLDQNYEFFLFLKLLMIIKNLG